MGNKHVISDLYQMQSLSLNAKVRMTQRRIREWVDEYGEDGVYISFSGGKDSTVLLNIARKLYPNIRAVFVDTGLEYPEIRAFVKGFDNVDWIRPKLTFREVIGKYGYPFISKEVSETVYYARKYMKSLDAMKEENTTRYNVLVDSVTLEEVEDKAKNELGMVPANDSQIVEYENSSDDYVKQYEEIPEDGVVASSKNVQN